MKTLLSPCFWSPLGTSCQFVALFECPPWAWTLSLKLDLLSRNCHT